MKGRRIKSLAELVDARKVGMSVVCSARCFNKPKPAAFMVNLSGAIIARLIEGGMWIYRK